MDFNQSNTSALSWWNGLLPVESTGRHPPTVSCFSCQCSINTGAGHQPFLPIKTKSPQFRSDLNCSYKNFMFNHIKGHPLLVSTPYALISLLPARASPDLSKLVLHINTSRDNCATDSSFAVKKANRIAL